MYNQYPFGLVVGESTVGSWSQAFTTPRIYGVVEVKDGSGAAQKIGLAFLSRLTKLCESEVAPAELVARIKELSEVNLVSVCLFCVRGKEVTTILLGVGRIYMKRGKLFAALMSAPGQLTGEVRPGDTFVLTTASFSRSVSQTELLAAFDHRPAAEVAEYLTVDLLRKKQVHNGAAVVVQMPPNKGQVMIADAKYKLVAVFRVALHQSIIHPKRMMVALVLGFFGLSVGVGVYRQLTDVRVQGARQQLAEAQQLFDEGVALLDLNSLKARERLTQSQALVSGLQARPLDPDSRQKLAALTVDLQQSLAIAARVYEREPELFFDAGLVKKDARVSAIAMYGDMLAMTDSVTRTVYTLDAKTKRAMVVGGGAGYDNLTSIDLHGQTVYALSATGVNVIDLAAKKSYPAVIPPAPEWKSVAHLLSFGGNIYLLDTGARRIWKYSGVDSDQPMPPKFSERSEYLNPDSFPDLSVATGFAIDGTIWLGTSGGKIIRLAQGQEHTYVPSGLESPFGSGLLVYTSDAVSNVYVLEAAASRLVVLDKEGKYVAQYRWKNRIQPESFLVSESLNRVFLLVSGQLYALNLL